MFQVWVDVRKIGALDQISRWWSSKHFNLVQFKRQNYLPSEKGLYQEVCATIKQHSGNEFEGEAYLLANLSYWGVCFNPIVFVACYQHDELRYLITEVHNTPWNQRFIYVHDTHSKGSQADAQGFHIANFDKAFHVSPFMPMDLQYRWKYRIDESSFFIKMDLLQNDQSIFSATMQLNGKTLSRKQATLLPFRFPLICIKVVVAIYWQALCLWCKRVPFFSYPK
ncbi:MAG: DUF1365 family protein [Arenicella sp.]|jgi:DUF1365 family protein